MSSASEILLACMHLSLIFTQSYITSSESDATTQLQPGKGLKMQAQKIGEPLTRGLPLKIWRICIYIIDVNKFMLSYSVINMIVLCV